MDLDPFEPLGIGASTMEFLDVFLLHCLLSESPPDTPAEIAALGRNQHRTAARGREPGLRLERGGADVGLAEWGAQLLDECTPIATALDALDGGSRHADALKSARATLQDPDSSPSARVLAAMAKDFDSSFAQFTRARSALARDALLALPYPNQVQDRFTAMSLASAVEQRRIEAADTMPFEAYRQQYLSPDRLTVSAACAAIEHT